MDTKLCLDTDCFSDSLTVHLQALQGVLLRQHDTEVASLRAEIKMLRDRLKLQVEDTDSRPPRLINPNPQLDALETSPNNQVVNASNAGREPEQGRRENAANAASTSGGEAVSQPVPQVTKDPPTLPKQAEAAPTKRQTSPRTKNSTSDVQEKPPSHSKSTDSRHHHELDDPASLSFLQRVVFSQTFECVSGGVILANTLMMALRLQYDAIDIGFDIGAGNFAMNAADTWPHAEDVFYWIEIGFTGVFMGEYLIRCLAMKLHSFKSGWMWFDGIVITVGAVDTFGSAALPVNPGMLRVLRLVRLVRLFKILKSMQAFDSLFLLQKAIIASMNAAVWSFGILIAVQLVVGLFLNQLMQTFLLEEGHSVEAKRRVYKFYGTFTGTMLTMFEITMASWVPACRVLVEEVSEYFILFFIFYRCFFCFAVLKVIAAVFITETNRVLQHDDELTLMKLHREKAMFDKKVKSLVAGFAGDSIGWSELEELAYDEDVKSHLSTFGFHSQDLEKLFWLIDNGSGNVPVDTFLAHVGGLKGPSKQVDMLTLLKLVHKIDQQVVTGFSKQGLMQSASQEEMAIEKQVCSLVSPPRPHKDEDGDGKKEADGENSPPQA